MKIFLIGIVLFIVLLIGGVWVAGGFEKFCPNCEYSKNAKWCEELLDPRLNLKFCDDKIKVYRWKLWIFKALNVNVDYSWWRLRGKPQYGVSCVFREDSIYWQCAKWAE